MCTFSMMYFPDMSELPGIALVWMMLSPWMSILTKPPFELKDTWDTKVKLYIHTYIYFYLLYMIYIYIYALSNFKKKPVLFNKHGALVESACVDLAVPGYLVSKNFVGKEYVKDANPQGVAWGEL